MGFYIEQADRSPQSRIAAEDIHVGELVHENGSDKYERLNGNDHSAIDALAMAPRSAEYIAPEFDDSSDFTYSASDNERVPAMPLSDGDVVKCRTIEDNGTDPAPSISDGDTVICPDASTADSAAEFEGRVVQDGYTDDSSDTYNASGTSLLVGTAYKPDGDVTSFDTPVRVVIRRSV